MSVPFSSVSFFLVLEVFFAGKGLYGIGEDINRQNKK
jgi:hypothetical protein